VSKAVLDASAILAVIDGEPGAMTVLTAIADGSIVSTVNLSEVVAKLTERGLSPTDIRIRIENLDLPTFAFDDGLAVDAGLLRAATRNAGLSLGDRACLALALRLGLPAMTADRAWQSVQVGVQIELVR
jgi:ribonuclease VapC